MQYRKGRFSEIPKWTVMPYFKPIHSAVIQIYAPWKFLLHPFDLLDEFWWRSLADSILFSVSISPLWYKWVCLPKLWRDRKYTKSTWKLNWTFSLSRGKAMLTMGLELVLIVSKCYFNAEWLLHQPAESLPCEVPGISGAQNQYPPDLITIQFNPVWN